jgi:hypothetical protein
VRAESGCSRQGDDPLLTSKIALAHLRELPDYYTCSLDGGRSKVRLEQDGWRITEHLRGREVVVDA